MDEVELSLLDKSGQEDADDMGEKGVKRPMSTRDRRAIVLLIILCEWAIPAYDIRKTEEMLQRSNTRVPRKSIRPSR